MEQRQLSRSPSEAFAAVVFNSRDYGQTYHGGNNGTVISAELTDQFPPRDQARGDKTEGSEGEDDRDDGKVHPTAEELVAVSMNDDGHD